MKRVFGLFEAGFDSLYLIFALVIGLVLLATGAGNPIRQLSGAAALVLAVGDGFHIFPRLALIFTHKEQALRPALGRGKQITSITMTVFYLLLWQVWQGLYPQAGGGLFSGLIWLLAAARITLCLLPQNRWTERYPPLRWGVRRNIPFFLMGLLLAGRFFIEGGAGPLSLLWLAILLSFGFYLPVVLLANKNPRAGMLMLPKTLAYLWMLAMFLAL